MSRLPNHQSRLVAWRSRILGAALCAAVLPSAVAAAPSASVSSASDAATTRRAPGPAVAPVPMWIDWRRIPAPPDAGAQPRGGLVVGTSRPVPAGWQSVSTQDAATAAAPVQSLRATNGQAAVLHLDHTRTEHRYAYHWSPQAASAASAAAIGTKPGTVAAGASSNAPSATNAGGQLTPWDETIHEVESLEVTPQWAGGRAPIRLQVSLRSTGRPAGGGNDEGYAPAALQLSTRLQLDWDQWLTLATVQGGTGMEALQIRVRRIP